MKVIWLHERRGINPRRIMKLFTGSIRQRKKKKTREIRNRYKITSGTIIGKSLFFCATAAAAVAAKVTILQTQKGSQSFFNHIGID